MSFSLALSKSVLACTVLTVHSNGPILELFMCRHSSTCLLTQRRNSFQGTLDDLSKCPNHDLPSGKEEGAAHYSHVRVQGQRQDSLQHSASLLRMTLPSASGTMSRVTLLRGRGPSRSCLGYHLSPSPPHIGSSGCCFLSVSGILRAHTNVQGEALSRCEVPCKSGQWCSADTWRFYLTTARTMTNKLPLISVWLRLDLAETPSWGRACGSQGGVSGLLELRVGWREPLLELSPVQQ